MSPVPINPQYLFDALNLTDYYAASIIQTSCASSCNISSRMLPGILCWAAAMLLSGAFAFLAFLVGLVIFPIVRHCVGLDPYSSSGDEPPPTVHVWSQMWCLSSQ